MAIPERHRTITAEGVSSLITAPTVSSCPSTSSSTSTSPRAVLEQSAASEVAYEVVEPLALALDDASGPYSQLVPSPGITAFASPLVFEQEAWYICEAYAS